MQDELVLVLVLVLCTLAMRERIVELFHHFLQSRCILGRAGQLIIT